MILHRVDGLTYLKKFAYKYRENLAKKDIRVTISGENIPILIDTEKMNIVLENLIMNAIRYTDLGGSITLVLKKVEKKCRL